MIMRIALVYFLLALTAVFPVLRAEPPVAPASQPDPIVGKWRYWNGEGYRLVTLNEDGTATSSSGLHGTWKYVAGQEVERKYKIIFKDGFYTDEVTLSTNGKRLNGRNAKKQNLHGERIEQ